MQTFKRFILASSFAYVYLILALLYPTDFSATLKGNVLDTKDMFTLGDIDVFNMHTIYVLNYAPISFFQYSLVSFDKSISLYETTRLEQSLSALERFQIGQIQKESSYHTALIVAFEKAQLSIMYAFKGYAVTSIPNAESLLKINDYIISIDDAVLTPYTDLASWRDSDALNLTIMRDNVLMNLTFNRTSNDLPLILYPMYTIIETERDISLIGLSSVIGGPSSGLMLTLSIYASLMQASTTFKIGGTGTMMINGDVGSIGGLYQKYMTAFDKLDYIFIPRQQVGSISNLDLSKVVLVSNIDEAIAFLESLYA